jgi:hypothetical protein
VDQGTCRQEILFQNSSILRIRIDKQQQTMDFFNDFNTVFATVKFIQNVSLKLYGESHIIDWDKICQLIRFNIWSI